MANGKIFFLFMWLIIELFTPIRSVSLYRNEKIIPVESFNEKTLKLLVGGQPKFNGQQNIHAQPMVDGESNIYDQSEINNQPKMYSQPTIQGVNAPDVITIHVDSFKRTKRAISESENITNSLSKTASADDSLCKRHKFQLNFTEIGMSWILHPEAVDVGFCKGSCNSKNAPSINHDGNVRNLAYENGLIPKQEDLCCFPTKFIPVKITYKHKTNTVQHVNVPDMIVEECECRQNCLLPGLRRVIRITF